VQTFKFILGPDCPSLYFVDCPRGRYLLALCLIISRNETLYFINAVQLLRGLVSEGIYCILNGMSGFPLRSTYLVLK
jgi:hypothetical protein